MEEKGSRGRFERPARDTVDALSNDGGRQNPDLDHPQAALASARVPKWKAWQTSSHTASPSPTDTQDAARSGPRQSTLSKWRRAPENSTGAADKAAAEGGDSRPAWKRFNDQHSASKSESEGTSSRKFERNGRGGGGTSRRERNDGAAGRDAFFEPIEESETSHRRQALIKTCLIKILRYMGMFPEVVALVDNISCVPWCG
jgi:hypothetical protein